MSRDVKGARFVAVGECMVELFAEDPVPVDAAQRFVRSFGGDCVQAALAAANLGTPSAVATVVGDDAFAASLLSWLRASGVSTDLVIERRGFTGLYLISVGPAGERSFAYYRTGSVASTLDASDVAWKDQPEAVLFTGITQAVSASSRGAALEAASRTKKDGGLVVYDVNFRPGLWGDHAAARRAFEEVLPLCTVVRAAAPEETSLVVGETDPIEAAGRLIDRGVPMVLIGCGDSGAVVATDGMVERVPPPRVRCIDTTGAGDAMTGGFIHGLLAGMSPISAAQVAVAAGSLAVTRRGGASAIPRGDEVLSMVEAMSVPR